MSSISSKRSRHARSPRISYQRQSQIKWHPVLSTGAPLGMSAIGSVSAEIFGWIKPIDGLNQLKVRGLNKANADFVFALVASDLVRITKLLEIPA
jgi:hypothetical protein